MLIIENNDKNFKGDSSPYIGTTFKIEDRKSSYYHTTWYLEDVTRIKK